MRYNATRLDDELKSARVQGRGGARLPCDYVLPRPMVARTMLRLIALALCGIGILSDSTRAIAMADPLDRITLDPAVRSGKPVIRGTRITISDILEYLAGGMSQEDILGDFPDLTPEDIRAALVFAATRERRLFSAS